MLLDHRCTSAYQGPPGFGDAASETPPTSVSLPQLVSRLRSVAVPARPVGRPRVRAAPVADMASWSQRHTPAQRSLTCYCSSRPQSVECRCPEIHKKELCSRMHAHHMATCSATLGDTGWPLADAQPILSAQPALSTRAHSAARLADRAEDLLHRHMPRHARTGSRTPGRPRRTPPPQMRALA